MRFQLGAVAWLPVCVVSVFAVVGELPANGPTGQGPLVDMLVAFLGATTVSCMWGTFAGLLVHPRGLLLPSALGFGLAGMISPAVTLGWVVWLGEDRLPILQIAAPALVMPVVGVAALLVGAVVRSFRSGSQDPGTARAPEPSA
ncbi:MAG: hypothetical protein KC656_01395 [Myxococcales bacterium]|nr:hypothetical protein [Myxococcales bacterium]MCB9669554.1 hypothetical protein [Alphaproteobacteria bacterium]MCB9692062.1 hypothetical protein [Alphaproteobacteria bacterium]